MPPQDPLLVHAVHDLDHSVDDFREALRQAERPMRVRNAAHGCWRVWRNVLQGVGQELEGLLIEERGVVDTLRPQRPQVVPAMLRHLPQRSAQRRGVYWAHLREQVDVAVVAVARVRVTQEDHRLGLLGDDVLQGVGQELEGLLIEQKPTIK